MKTLFNILCLVAIFLPFQFALNIAPGIDLAVLRVVVLVLSFIVVSKSFIDKNFIFPVNWQSILLTAFFVLNIFSLFFADNLIFAARKILFLSSLIPLYFVVFYIVESNKEKIERLGKCLIVGGVLSLVAGVIIFLNQYIFGIDKAFGFYEKIGPLFWGQSFSESVLGYQSFLVNVGGVDYLRMASFFPDPHNFALFAGVISFLSLGSLIVFINQKQLNRAIFYSGVLLLGSLGLFLSFSRAAYLALATALFVVLSILSIKSRNSSGRIAVVLMGVVLFLPFLILPAKDRFLDIFSQEDGSNIGRIQILKDGLNVFKDNFLFGVGIGNAPLHYNEDIDYRNPANSHNTYLEIAIENGIFGLLVWCLLIFGTGAQLVRSLKKSGNLYALGLLGALTFFAVHSLFEVFLYSPINLSLLMMLLAMSSVEILNIKNQSASWRTK